MRFKQLSSAVLILFLLASCGGGGSPKTPGPAPGGGGTPPPANDNAPVMSSANTADVAENTLAVLTLTATDADNIDGQTQGFSLGGSDASLFSILDDDKLVFDSAPDFEDPMCGSGSNQNSCQVTITPTDGTNTGTAQTITITVTNVNDIAPVMSSSNTVTVPENTRATLLTLTATDADNIDGQTQSFSLGGSDTRLFSISGSALAFNSPPDFESLICGGDNVCEITITPDDGVNTGEAQAIRVTVTNLEDGVAPVMTSANSANLNENTNTVLINLSASDSDSPAAEISFTLGGTDASAFTITSANALMFNSAPDAETICTRDAVSNAVCEITVTPTDGNNNSGMAQVISVTVTNLNDNAPVISSANSASVSENSTAVLTIIASDADNLVGQIQSFSLGGNDANLFSISLSDSVLAFNSAPDFENPVCRVDNQCQVTITPTDGSNRGIAQDIAITVTNVNDIAPVMSSSKTVSVAENTPATVLVLRLTATDADNLAGQTQSFSLGGSDASLFNIVNDDELVFNSAPDFESRLCGSDNVCEITITPSDGTNTGTAQTIRVGITDVDETTPGNGPPPPSVNDDAPVMSSPNTASVPENSTAVLTLTATDADSPFANISFTLGGTDASLFSIFSIASVNGLRFKIPPDFEDPMCGSGADQNICQITVTPSDGTNTGTAQTITITVIDVDENTPAPAPVPNPPPTPVSEAPVMSSADTASVPENSTAVLTLTATDADSPAASISFTLGGTDASLFNIVSTNRLVFNSAPDFETPICGGDNICEITITPSDGTNTGIAQAITVTVTDGNDNNVAPVIISANTASVPENSVAVLTLIATDADNVAGQTQGFRLSGSDASLFSIINDNKLVFNSAPNFETRICGGDNVCQVTITPTDGTYTGIAQDITITVTNLNDIAPVMNSPNTASAPENTLATALVLRLTATDADNITGQFQSFSLGGSDASLFSISGSALTFSSPPDAETICTRNVADGSAVCEITVTPSDGTNTGIAQDITITVANLNDEAPVMTSLNTASVLEDSVAVLTLTATDADNVAGQTQGFILGGSDASLFSIINDNELVFSSAPDFETPMCGSGTDQNSCQITITPTDGTNSGVAQTISITISDIPNLMAFDTAVIEGNAGTTTLHTVSLYLAQGTASVEYQLRNATASIGDSDWFTAGSTVIGGTLNFNGGGTQVLTIQINGDSKLEKDEIFYIDLDDPVNLELLNPIFAGPGQDEPTTSISITIINDDFPPLFNDTGVLYSGNYPSGNNAGCTGNNTATFSLQQDCSHGRDANTATVKTGTGLVAFDFTKLGADGSELAIQTSTYSVLGGTEAAGTLWSCVRDNHTGLVWQVHTDFDSVDAGNSDYDKDNRYAWGGTTAVGRDHPSERGTYRDDWNDLVSAANGLSSNGLFSSFPGGGTNALCGFTDWRVPKVYELSTISHLGLSDPAADVNFFPFTQSPGNFDSYWTASPLRNNNGQAWFMSFQYGNRGATTRSNELAVRLVRSDF